MTYFVLIYYLNIPVTVEVNVEMKFRYGRNEQSRTVSNTRFDVSGFI